MSCIHLAATPIPLTKIHSRTFEIVFWSRLLSMRISLWRRVSAFVPVEGICAFLIRQRGQGHLERYLMHARRTLHKVIGFVMIRSKGAWLLTFQGNLLHM